MRSVLTYIAMFVVSAVVVQFFLFDSIRLGVLFSPAAYVAFVILLPIQMRPLGVLLLGFLLGVFVDFFEGTMGLHTMATLLAAYLRRWVMAMTLGKEVAAETMGMPSTGLLGRGKFFRYVTALVFLHCFVLFNLEALSVEGYWTVVGKTLVSGTVTVYATWALGLLFAAGRRARRYGA